MIKDYPKKVVLSAVETKVESEVEDNNLSSILGGVEDKMGHGLLFADMVVAGRKLNALVGTWASNLFMSEGAAHKLGLKIENEPGRIKTVNQKVFQSRGFVVVHEKKYSRGYRTLLLFFSVFHLTPRLNTCPPLKGGCTISWFGFRGAFIG
ncbi:hypothetical protein J1N35_022615 [Gossypium stocksii]|uniref:Uncharacterized protein n=1 Tax=Gossypium stocksii TaxID=47602 RepID=A0A9D4A3N0_9ROSI|nr:hypothetical protein J1N35_022615 [Gossypium stocksii]